MLIIFNNCVIEVETNFVLGWAEVEMVRKCVQKIMPTREKDFALDVQNFKTSF